MIFGLFIGLGGLISLIETFRYGPLGSLKEKSGELSLGMTEEELTKIMGKPRYIRTVRADEIDSPFPDARKSVEEAIRKYGQVVEYAFGKRMFGWTGEESVGGIYLDKEHGRIILLRVQSWWFDQALAGEYEKYAVLAFCIAVSWIGLHLWCKRLRKRRDSQPGMDPPS
jgi:hypothetical protein